MTTETKETQEQVSSQLAEKMKMLEHSIEIMRCMEKDRERSDGFFKFLGKFQEETEALLVMAEAQLEGKADSGPLLKVLLEAVGSLILPSCCMSSKDGKMITRIIALLPVETEIDDVEWFEKALAISQRTECISCRELSSVEIIDAFMKMMPDPDARTAAKERLLSCLEKLLSKEAEHLCEYPTEKAESDCKRIREEAERKCREVRKWAEEACDSFRERAHMQLGSVREGLERKSSAKESGEFQKPDFAKKPATQPPEGPKMKRES